MEFSSSHLVRAAASVAELGWRPEDFVALDDVTLLEVQRRHSALKHQVDLHGAWIAGELARRSSHGLGYLGLAQKQGFFSPEELIQSLSGSSRSEASKLVKVGLLMAESQAAEEAEGSATKPVPEQAEPSGPSWHSPIARAVSDSALALDVAEAIRTTLAEIADRVPNSVVREACERLISDAATRNADQMFRRARQVRDQIDEAGISEREARQYGERSLRVWRRRDGMIQTSLVAHPEEGEPLLAWYHDALGPRRGGPRFTDPAAQREATALLADSRTNEQIAADAFFDLFRSALDINPATMVGHRRPSVRIIVTDHAVRAAADDPARGAEHTTRISPSSPQPGHGRIEGVLDPVSIATVERYLCDTGAVPVAFDDEGQCVNVGRDQRLFTSRQRIALAVRDGGCLFPNCGRPPSFCEAHHINFWARDRGNTNVADGVLLCRRHHLLLHNNGWEIVREHGSYWLVPPRSVDPLQVRIPLPSKNPDLWDLPSRAAQSRAVDPPAGRAEERGFRSSQSGTGQFGAGQSGARPSGAGPSFSTETSPAAGGG
ncbi:DUF222 domain-containing protein [Lacisediminihabitans profunda]|uniref:DUF222 domain-containing protein n=1 Tax=Lacisediminihabitans profunda TaxID=2594790 RepID=A0A5C8UW95_9MICO|nr:DUF222 domain-containing protein [Lacisediminihabitans profunda]TXN31928.1 DUF222 domain-containing protein [Lacisediminihabitans profunda]